MKSQYGLINGRNYQEGTFRLYNLQEAGRRIPVQTAYILLLTDETGIFIQFVCIYERKSICYGIENHCMLYGHSDEIINKKFFVCKSREKHVFREYKRSFGPIKSRRNPWIMCLSSEHSQIHSQRASASIPRAYR